MKMREHCDRLRLVGNQYAPETPWGEIKEQITDEESLCARVESLELQVALLATLVAGKQDKRKDQ